MARPQKYAVVWVPVHDECSRGPDARILRHQAEEAATSISRPHQAAGHGRRPGDGLRPVLGHGFPALPIPDSAGPSTAASVAMAGSVAAAWIVLALSRRWLSESGWIDRMGRILGAIAIANGLLGLVVHRI